MRAKIEDFNGKLIREYEPFTNESIATQKTSSEFTPNLEEGKAFILDSNVTVDCNDINLNNNFDTQIITIKGKPLESKSSIKIESILDLGSDDQAEFGQVIRVRMSAYKGNTDKESISVWIEDSKGNKLSKQSKANLEAKYTNYFLTIPVQIIPNCDLEFGNDDYLIMAEGLDSDDQKEIEIEDLTESMCGNLEAEIKKSDSGNFAFELKDFNEIIDVGHEFKTKVLLDNNNDEDINIRLWSYVYRGSKPYSGEREENMEEFILKANSLQVIELGNIVEEAEQGNYKFKVLVNKNGQKTNNEVTRDILIRNNRNKTNDSGFLEEKQPNVYGETINNTISSVISPSLVYESTTEKAKNLVPTFIILLSVILNLVLIWRR